MNLTKKDEKRLRAFFEENWSAEATDDGYTTAVMVGDITKEEAIKKIKVDEDIKLAVKFGLIDQSWVDETIKRVKCFAKRKGKKPI